MKKDKLTLSKHPGLVVSRRAWDKNNVLLSHESPVDAAHFEAQLTPDEADALGDALKYHAGRARMRREKKRVGKEGAAGSR